MNPVWADPVGDVRKILSDGPTDKLRYRKAVMNQLDGVNTIFKTFERRRVTTLVTATPPVGVYVNNSLVSVSAEDLESGEFTLATAPPNGATLTATYYIQWFDDDELIGFLIQAAEWIQSNTCYAEILESLRPAAKEFAASVAYQKLAAWWSENIAEQYQLYDAPDKERWNPVTAYLSISEKKYKRALELRNDVYQNRKGMALAPISAVIRGRVRDVPPNA
jgi:hypothetical protein